MLRRRVRRGSVRAGSSKLTRSGETSAQNGAAWSAYCTVRPSLTAATGALERSEAREVVPIDDWLSGGARSRSPVPSAFELVPDCRAVRPRAAGLDVCCTRAAWFPPMAHAFCTQGGAHVIDKQQQPGWDSRLDMVGEAVDGVRWRHSPHPSLVRFTPRDIEVLSPGCRPVPPPDRRSAWIDR